MRSAAFPPSSSGESGLGGHGRRHQASIDLNSLTLYAFAQDPDGMTVPNTLRLNERGLISLPSQNILDALSYGLITYPTSVPAFANFGGIGYSQFFVS